MRGTRFEPLELAELHSATRLPWWDVVLWDRGVSFASAWYCGEKMCSLTEVKQAAAASEQREAGLTRKERKELQNAFEADCETLYRPRCVHCHGILRARCMGLRA